MSKLERWLGCLVLDHAFSTWQELTKHSRRVVCLRCHKSWGMNDEVQAFIPWTRELEAMYTDVFKIRIREWKP